MRYKPIGSSSSSFVSRTDSISTRMFCDGEHTVPSLPEDSPKHLWAAPSAKAHLSELDSRYAPSDAFPFGHSQGSITTTMTSYLRCAGAVQLMFASLASLSFRLHYAEASSRPLHFKK